MGLASVSSETAARSCDLVVEPIPAQQGMMRDKIFALEHELLKHQQIEIETTHHFAPGIYMRQVRIPADGLVTGAIHKTEHLNILAQGELTVWTDEGMKRLKAPTVIKSSPGTKRAGYAHTEVVWITVHPNVTDERDVEKLRVALTTNSFAEFLEYIEAEKLKLIGQGGP
jgi:hypothetical protein